MNSTSFRVTVYPKGSAEMLEATLIIDANLELYIDGRDRITLSIPEKPILFQRHGPSESMIDIGGNQIIVPKVIEKELRSKLWPDNSWRKSPAAVSVLSAGTLLICVLVGGMILENNMPDVLKTMISDSVRVEAKVCVKKIPDDIASKLSSLGHDPEKLYFSEWIEPNAFALPDDSMVFTEGLVKNARSQEEFLAVFFHELGHIKLNHTKQSVGRQWLTQLLIRNVVDDASSLFGTLAMNQYSQEHEEDADAYALEQLRRFQIDSQGGADFFNRMAQMEPSLLEKLSFLNTHPETRKRARLFANQQVKNPLKIFTKKQWRVIVAGCDQPVQSWQATR